MHWHLMAPREWRTTDPERFSDERARVERKSPTAGVARTPDEVVAWLEETLDNLIAEHEHTPEMLRSSGIATPEDRASRAETARWMAGLGKDVCSVLALRGGRIAHYSAYAEPECTAIH